MQQKWEVQLSLLHRSGRGNKSKPERFKQKKIYKENLWKGKIKKYKKKTAKKEWNRKQECRIHPPIIHHLQTQTDH